MNGAELSNFYLIHNVPLDSMHMIDLGVVKTFFKLLFEGPREIRLPLKKRKLATEF